MTRPILTVVLIVAVFGILVPYYKRYDFLDPVLLAAYFCLPLVLVAPMAADALAGSGESMRNTVQRVLGVAAYGWGLGVVVIAAGLMTVNAITWHGRLLIPGLTFLGAGAFCSAAAALAVATASGGLARRFSARTAKTVLRLLFLVVLVAIVLVVRGASPELSSAFWQHMTSSALTRFGFYSGAVLVVIDAGAVWALGRMRAV